MKQHANLKFLLLIVLFLGASITSANKCAHRAYKTGIVCVCNATYCDTLEFATPETNGNVLIVSTSQNGLRFNQLTTQFGEERFQINDEKENLKPTASIFSSRNVVTINRNATFQKIIGFGNAFTGAVSHNLKLVPELQDHIYKSYFSRKAGLGFNIMRIPIGGCDFDLEPWAYNESPINDLALSNFTKLDARDLERIDQLKNLMKVSENSDIKFVGAAWSAPKWMKTNNEWSGFGSLKDECYQTWANYHVKYLELMKEKGINFWAISTGNEPLNGVTAFLFIKFMSLGWLPITQAKWVSENLGPALRKSLVSNVNILAGDDQRYTFPWWFSRMYNTYPESRKFVDGHAVHWYWDKYAGPNLLDQTFAAYPEKLIIATEACSGDKPWEEHRPVLGYWTRCEDYTLDIIEDLNHHVNAWIDWNLVLDEKGGPNYANNFVDSPIVVNATSKKEFYKQPMFYALGHFSRFLIPDSVRIASTSSNRYVFTTASLRPDGLVAVVVYNSATYAIDVDVSDSSRGVLKLTIPPKSIHSMLYK